MSNHSFTLKSGAKLSITTAPFEVAINLVEAVKKATFGLPSSIEIPDVVLSNPEVRLALYAAWDTCLYDTARVSKQLFDDPKLGDKARADYFEICSRVIEVNSKPFFLNLRSESTVTEVPPTENPRPQSPSV